MSDKRFFRLAAGEANRDYSFRFIESDIGAIGPGVGDLIDSPDQAALDGLGSDKRGMLLRFAGVQEGDLILLANGWSPITVGRATKDRPKGQVYRYTEGIGLFGHWDLYNVIRVKWADPRDPLVEEALANLKDTHGPVKVRGSFRELGGGSEDVRDWMGKLDAELDRAGHWDRSLKDAGLDQKPVKDVQNLEAFQALNRDVQTGIRRVVKTGNQLWEDNEHRGWDPLPSEHEAVALLVVPFLMALGWTPSQIALEWNWVDVATFAGLERSEPRLLVEAKRPLTGMDWARSQVFKYAADVHASAPVITTDGYYWALFNDEKLAGELFLPRVYESAGSFFDSLGACLPPT